MTQDEARIKLIDILKENKKVNKTKLIKLHLITLVVFIASIGIVVKGSVDISIGTAFNGGIAVIYATLLGKFFRRYENSKSAVKRLETCFEEDLDYVELYEKYLKDTGMKTS